MMLGKITYNIDSINIAFVDVQLSLRSYEGNSLVAPSTNIFFALLRNSSIGEFFSFGTDDSEPYKYPMLGISTMDRDMISCVRQVRRSQITKIDDHCIVSAYYVSELNEFKGSPRDRELKIISLWKTAHYIVVGIIQVNGCLKYACHKRRRENNRLFRRQDDPDAYWFEEYIHIS